MRTQRARTRLRPPIAPAAGGARRAQLHLVTSQYQRLYIASTEKIAQEKFFFQGGREKIVFFREIKMVYGSIARPERSKLDA